MCCLCFTDTQDIQVDLKIYHLNIVACFPSVVAERERVCLWVEITVFIASHVCKVHRLHFQLIHYWQK